MKDEPAQHPDFGCTVDHTIEEVEALLFAYPAVYQQGKVRRCVDQLKRQIARDGVERYRDEVSSFYHAVDRGIESHRSKKPYDHLRETYRCPGRAGHA